MHRSTAHGSQEEEEEEEEADFCVSQRQPSGPRVVSSQAAPVKRVAFSVAFPVAAGRDVGKLHTILLLRLGGWVQRKGNGL